MAHLCWTEDAVSIGGICERGFTVERPMRRLERDLWYSWGMGEVDTSVMSAW